MLIRAYRWRITHDNAMITSQQLSKSQQTLVIRELSRPANHPRSPLTQQVCVKISLVRDSVDCFQWQTMGVEPCVGRYQSLCFCNAQCKRCQSGNH